jgi:hypothetical protein
MVVCLSLPRSGQFTVDSLRLSIGAESAGASSDLKGAGAQQALPRAPVIWNKP